MALDSLGLGLTLDTTLLEKADKTLENMHKNSKLIMQNLTRGFTAFSEGKIGNFTQVFDDVSEAMDRLSKAKVSPDFDTKGQEKYIDRMEHLLTIVEKMSKIDGAKFFDPTEVYVTDKDATDIFGEMQALQEYKKELAELVNIIKNYGPIQQGLKEEMGKLGGEITEQEKEVKALSSAYDEAKKKQEAALKAMATQLKTFSTRERKKDSSLTDEQLLGMFSSRESMQKYVEAVTRANEELVKAEEKLMDSTEKLEGYQSRLNATQQEYKSNIGIKKREDEIKASYDLIKEQEKILQSEMKYATATEAERAAMLTKRNEAEIKADQKRIRDVQKSYETLRKEIQKGEKDIADLEESRATLKEAGRPTAGLDAQIKQRRTELNKLMQDELEFRSSQYWPKLQAIDEKFNSEAFIKNQKALAKQAAKESRKDVTAALQYSKNAQSINEEKEAIKRLIEARDNLSTSSKRYQKTVEDINKRILAHKDHIEAVTRVEKEQNTLADSVINRYRKQLKELDELNEALDELAKKQQSTGALYNAEEMRARIDLTDRRDTVQKDILEIEKNAQGQLDVIREQHDAERAKKKVDSILKENEREKQEYAKLLDDLYAIEKQKKAMEAEGGGVGDAAYDNLLQQEVDLNARKSQLEARHQNDLDEIRKKHNKKRNDDEVKAFIAAEKEKQRIAEETAKKMREKARKYGTISSASADRLIGVTDNAKNINQHKAAIKKLEQARASLDNTDKNYYLTLKKIEKALQRHHKELRLAGVESNNLMQSHRGLLNIGGQLARRLALVFSVSQLTQYFRKLVEVRGQFEKTEVALTSIIGDNQKAEKLMNQTIALAIKSPFTLQQLTGYTKQLAAYQVSYEELHSTTKMLADVSAGLGVEMDRLILAFGQVKAANYLRATEVRQFTEAGFNILGELADYYNELEGTMLSVGDVQEMVTKRMVDFADVEAVFHRVTEAGGMFFDMQSKQAETLAGQWTNLQDRIDVMLNEIGSDKDGLLKGIVSTLASLIDNWEALADVLKIVIGAFALYKMNLLAVTKAQITNSIAARTLIKEEIKMLGLTKGLSSAWKGLGLSVNFTNGAMKKFFAANAWLLALTAILSVIASVISHFNKLNDAVDENTRAFSENRSEVKKLAEEYSELNSALSETTDKEKKLAIIEEKRAKLQELSVKLRERGLKLTDSEGNMVDPKSIDVSLLDELFTSNKEKLDDAYKLGEELGESITRGLNAAQGNILGFSFFGENLQEDAEDLGQTYGKIASHTFSAYMDDVEADIHNNYEELSQRSQTLYKELAEGRKAEKNDKGEVVKWLESEYDWTKRRLHLLQEISFIDNDTLGVQLKLNNARANLANAESEFSHELERVLNKLIEKYGSIEALKKEYEKNPQVISAAIKTEVDKQSWDESVKWFAEQDLHAQLTIEYNYVEVVSSETPEKVYEGFKKDLIEARTNLEKSGEGYSNFFISTEDIDKMEQFTDGLEVLQKAYDENIKKRESLKDTTTEEGKAELLMVNAIIAEVERLAAAWGYTLETKGGKGKDEVLEKLKNRINLIKEMNKEYEKLNKTFSKAESLAKVQKAYADTAKELKLDISKMDFTDKGTIETLEKLLGDPKYSANKYALELKKALDGFKAEVDLEADEQKTRELVDQVQEIFDQYELAADIKKLNIPLELAKNLFGVDTKSFDQMRTEIISKFAGTNAEVSKILSKGSIMSAEDEQKLIDLIGKERVDEAKKAIEKIDDLEDKQQLERLKKYVEYAKKGLSERAKIKVEEMTKLQEIEETFNKAIANAKTKEDKKRIKEQRKLAISGVQREASQSIAKMDWEEFRKSETFISLFDDLGGASDAILTKVIEDLDKFKTEWKDLPLDQMKEVIELRNKAQRAMESNDSPWGEAKRLRGLIEDDGRTREEAELDSYNAEQEKARLEKELEMIGLINQKRAEGVSDEQLKIVLGEKYGYLLGENVDLVAREVDLTNKLIPAQDSIIDKSQERIQNEKDLIEAYKKQEDTLREVQNMTNDLYDSFKELSEALGGDSESPAAVFADMGMSMANSVLNAIMLSAQLKTIETGAMAAGTALNTAMGVIGWIVMGVQLLTAGIKAIVKINDNQIVSQLEDQAAIIERQRDLYEQIEEKVDKAYSVEQLRQYNDEMKRSVDLEIQALEASIALERSRKNADEDQIADWQKEIDEARKRLEESTQEMTEMVGGIFDLEDFTSGFIDAWWDAMEEGMDGLDALNDHFEDTMKDLIKKQALYKGAQKIMEQVMNAINADLEGDYDIDDWSEIERIAKKANIDLDAFLQGYKEIFNSISNGEAGGLSALQKGIQGITEQTAQVLESYLNSVRMYVATISADTTSQLNEVKAIHRLLDSVTLGGHSRGGVGFKVFMD